MQSRSKLLNGKTDRIVVKVCHNGSVINKAVFLALGINIEGQKDEEYIPQGYVDG